MIPSWVYIRHFVFLIPLGAACRFLEWIQMPISMRQQYRYPLSYRESRRLLIVKAGNIQDSCTENRCSGHFCRRLGEPKVTMRAFKLTVLFRLYTAWKAAMLAQTLTMRFWTAWKAFSKLRRFFQHCKLLFFLSEWLNRIQKQLPAWIYLAACTFLIIWIGTGGQSRW